MVSRKDRVDVWACLLRRAPIARRHITATTTLPNRVTPRRAILRRAGPRIALLQAAIPRVGVVRRTVVEVEAAKHTDELNARSSGSQDDEGLLRPFLF